MSKFTHFILTRYNLGLYDLQTEEAEAWMQHRYVYFKRCRHSVLMQDVQFRWVLFFDSRTPQEWIDLICTDSCMEAETGMNPINYPIADKCDTDWVITTRLDNDDTYLRGALKAIQEAFAPMVMCIDIEYYGYDNRHYYTSNRGTATSFFISLVEPRESAIGVYHTIHSKIRKAYPVDGKPTNIPEVMIKTPYAVMVVHGLNLANKIVGKRIEMNKIQ